MVDHVIDRYLDDYLALDPLSATYLGVSGHDDEVPDLSPDGLAEVSALRRRTLAELWLDEDDGRAGGWNGGGVFDVWHDCQ